MAKWTKQQTINLAVQQLALKELFPDARCWISRSELKWEGTLTPSALSRDYLVRVTYSLNDSPDVEVLHPALEMREGKKPPHLYKGDKLCLCLPRTGEWDMSMLLSETIIPWTSEWLLHYEIWFATGDWRGGGIHPTKKSR